MMRMPHTWCRCKPHQSLQICQTSPRQPALPCLALPALRHSRCRRHHPRAFQLLLCYACQRQ
jgi:hypothetical protein